MRLICGSDASNDMGELTTVIPGRCKASNPRCAIAHRGISRFSDVQLHIEVRADARPGMTSYCCFTIGACRTSESITRELPDQGAAKVAAPCGNNSAISRAGAAPGIAVPDDFIELGDQRSGN